MTENVTVLRVAEYDDSPPPRVATSLRKAPKVRDLYWCRLPQDAELPEFWKERPAVVISKNAGLTGTVMVVPCTSQDQKASQWAVKLDISIDGRESWAVCDKPMSVAVSRLRAQRTSPRITEQDFTLILAKVLQVTPTPIISGDKKEKLRLLIDRKHGTYLKDGLDSTKILDDVLGWIQNIRD